MLRSHMASNPHQSAFEIKGHLRGFHSSAQLSKEKWKENVFLPQMTAHI